MQYVPMNPFIPLSVCIYVDAEVASNSSFLNDGNWWL